MFATIASRNTNSNLVSAVVNVVSAILPVALVLPILDRKLLVNGKLGITVAVLAGISIAIFSMAFNKSLQTNKVGIVSPLIFGGAIFLSTILSYFFLKEKISLVQSLGLFFLAVGFGFIIYSASTGKWTYED